MYMYVEHESPIDFAYSLAFAILDPCLVGLEHTRTLRLTALTGRPLTYMYVSWTESVLSKMHLHLFVRKGSWRVNFAQRSERRTTDNSEHGLRHTCTKRQTRREKQSIRSNRKMTSEICRAVRYTTSTSHTKRISTFPLRYINNDVAAALSDLRASREAKAQSGQSLKFYAFCEGPAGQA
jgi:hypothetical protein